MSIQFKKVSKKNIAEALSIYNWYVINSTATFHLEPVNQEELERMLSIGHVKYQSFIIEYNNKVCGFCYISQFRYKEAYDSSAEITLYLAKDYARKGIGKITLVHLEEIAKQNNIENLVAVITEGNNASIALFERLGYFKVGHLKRIGKKFGQTLDVVSYQKEI